MQRTPITLDSYTDYTTESYTYKTTEYNSSLTYVVPKIDTQHLGCVGFHVVWIVCRANTSCRATYTPSHSFARHT